MTKVRVDGIEEAVAASLALRRADKELRRQITKEIRSEVNPMWKGVVEANAASHMDQRVLAKGARVTAGARPALIAASSRKALRGGLVPAYQWRPFEFGSKSRNLKVTYTRRSPKGKSHKVSRRTGAQLPRHAKAGRTLYPALGDVGARIFSLWAQTAIRAVFDALQGRR